MTELSDLTIIVPTYARQRYALRQMRFWSRYPVNLHVLDGTDKPIHADHLTGLSSGVHYHHLPVPLTARLHTSIDLIETPYSALLGDDDFFIPSALLACIDRLKEKTEFVACMGRCVGFDVAWNKLLGSLRYTEMRDYRIDSDAPRDRVTKHMTAYTPSTVYSVMKSAVMKNNLSIVSSVNFSSPYVSEIQWELATAYQGKSEVIDVLMWLRSFENPPISNASFDRKLHFDDWYFDEQYENQVALFYDVLVNHLAGDDRRDECRNELHAAVDAYISFFRNRFLPAQRSLVNSPAYRIKAVLRKLFPARLYAGVRNWRDRFVASSVMDKARELSEKENMVVDFEQLGALEAAVLDARNQFDGHHCS